MHHTGSVPSAMTVTQQVPSMDPVARMVSTPIGTSKTLLPCHECMGLFGSGAWKISLGFITGVDEPPGMTQRMPLPPMTPPATSKISSFSVGPTASSMTHGFFTWPLTP